MMAMFVLLKMFFFVSWKFFLFLVLFHKLDKISKGIDNIQPNPYPLSCRLLQETTIITLLHDQFSRRPSQAATFVYMSRDSTLFPKLVMEFHVSESNCTEVNSSS